MTLITATVKLLGRLQQFHQDELRLVNAELAKMGLPPYVLEPGFIFNPDYRLYDIDQRPPRFVIVRRGWRPGLRLSELYLFYMPHVGDRVPNRGDMITVVIPD